jgi:hypothetical protein
LKRLHRFNMPLSYFSENWVKNGHSPTLHPILGVILG